MPVAVGTAGPAVQVLQVIGRQPAPKVVWTIQKSTNYLATTFQIETTPKMEHHSAHLPKPK
jgi:hypothetical protein